MEGHVEGQGTEGLSHTTRRHNSIRPQILFIFSISSTFRRHDQNSAGFADRTDNPDTVRLSL